MPRNTQKTTTDLSRRQFLVRSAGLAGASLGLGVGKEGAAAENGSGPGPNAAEIRIGLAGAGERGAALLELALQCPGIRIAAIADVDPQHLARARDLARGHKPAATASFEKLAEFAARGDVDAIVIATPPHLHAQQALAALDAGAHVYLEKPLALTVEDCRRVRRQAALAETRGRVFQIGLERRYNPRYLASIEAIRRGDAGKILFVRAQWHALGEPSSRKSWYFQREASGDLIVEQACHQMDVFNWIFQSTPLHACGLGGMNRPAETRSAAAGRTTRDHYGLLLEYPEGSKVELSHLTYAVPDRRFSGIYELAFGEHLGIDLASAQAWDRRGKLIQLSTEGGSDTRLAIEAFFRQVRRASGSSPQKEPPAAGIEAAYKATLTSLLGLKALDEGRLVRWQELDPESAV